jgi:hypothetical protein
MSDPFNSGTAGISLALDVPFPANVESGPGIEVDKTNGNWTVGLGYPPLVDAGVPANPSTIYLAAYDTGLQAYEKLRLDNIIAGATGLDSRTPRGDANYGILVSDRYLALTAALTAVRTWTLPAAASVPPGRVVTIQDEAGGISGQNHLNVVPTGADTIDGLPNYRLKARYGGLSFRSDGASKWSLAYSWQVTLIADAAYVAQQGDLTIAYASISAARVVSLPAANTYPAGQRLTVIDYSGSCSASNTISLARAGADTINGATSQVINQAYGYLALISDGISKWTVVDTSSIGATTISANQIIGGALNAVPVGNTTPASGAFTTLSSTGNASIGGTLTVTGSSTLGTTSVGAITGSSTATFGAVQSTPVGSVTPATGAFTTLSSTGAATFAGPLTVNSVPFAVVGQCRLSRFDATHLILRPYNGNMLKIAGQLYAIPAAGVQIANGTFSASTLYYIYALQTAGVISLENSATAHSTDNTAGNVGVEIKSGDNTRTLVGFVVTDGSSNFIDTDTNRWTLSWFNRQPKRLRNQFTASKSTVSTSFVEIDTQIRCNFLAWADDLPDFVTTGQMSGSSTNVIGAAISFDGAAPAGTVDTTGPQGTCFSTHWAAPVTEFSTHYATLFGATTSGTGNFIPSSIASGGFCELHGTING